MALTELQDSWGGKIASHLAILPSGPKCFQVAWQVIMGDVLKDDRNVISGIELLNRALRSEPIRERVARSQEEARIKLADLFLPSSATTSLEDKRALRMIMLARMSGLMNAALPPMLPTTQKSFS